MIKRLIGFITVFALMAQVPAPVAFAASAPVLRASASAPATVSAGSEISVSVSIENNPGIAVFIIDLKYNEAAFEYVSVAKGGLFTDSISSREGAFDDYRAVRVLLAQLEKFSGNGVLYTVKFRAKTGISSGDYPFAPVYTQGNIIGSPNNEVNPTVVNASVKVTSQGTNGGDTPGGGDTSGSESTSRKPSDKTISDVNTPLTDAGSQPGGTQDNGVWNNPYSDVSEANWYYLAARFVTEKGLMTGTAADIFSPGVTMSRAMLVTVLYRMEGSPAISGDIPFRDVSSGQWYSNAVLWANKNDIVKGYTDGSFGLNDPVTREQAVTILYRYAVFKSIDVNASANLTGYADAGDVSDWAISSIKWAVDKVIIQGRTETTIVPKGTSTRAEVATIFKRYIENVLG